MKENTFFLTKDLSAGTADIDLKENYVVSEHLKEVPLDVVAIIPKNIVIHRLTGDGAKKDLIAPLWSADKKRVLNAINKALRES